MMLLEYWKLKSGCACEWGVGGRGGGIAYLITPSYFFLNTLFCSSKDIKYNDDYI